MEEIIKMHQEEIEMQKFIHDYIDKYSREKAVDILRKYLDLSEKDNTKLAFCLENAECGKMFDEKHDILCCMVKALGYNKAIPKENIYSKSDICEYDPAKNGKNILKHNLSFREIVSYLCDDKAHLITDTKTKKDEERAVHFCAIRENENVVAICSVVTFPKPLRFISARYFSSDMSESDIDIFIKEIIKDNTLSDDYLEDLRNYVKDFLKDYGYFINK